MPNKIYIASISGGQDSTAMTVKLLCVSRGKSCQ